MSIHMSRSLVGILTGFHNASGRSSQGVKSARGVTCRLSLEVAWSVRRAQCMRGVGPLVPPEVRAPGILTVFQLRPKGSWDGAACVRTVLPRSYNPFGPSESTGLDGSSVGAAQPRSNSLRAADEIGTPFEAAHQSKPEAATF